MKSKDRIEREREKRSMLIAVILIGFVFLIACALMILSFSGDNNSVGNFLNAWLYKLKEVFETVWFKVSNFLNFLKR